MAGLMKVLRNTQYWEDRRLIRNSVPYMQSPERGKLKKSVLNLSDELALNGGSNGPDADEGMRFDEKSQGCSANGFFNMDAIQRVSPGLKYSPPFSRLTMCTK